MFRETPFYVQNPGNLKRMILQLFHAVIYILSENKPSHIWSVLPVAIAHVNPGNKNSVIDLFCF